MPYVLVNGVRLYYEEHGAGEPILCIHGTGSAGYAWAAAAEKLAALGRVIIYDRRGFTRSGRDDLPDVTEVGEHGDDAHALLTSLDAAPAVIIGRSYGGGVALDLALRHTEVVRALGGELVIDKERLRDVAVSTLVVSAADSPPIFAAVTAEVESAIPGAQAVRVEGGHLIHPAHPEVLAFVSSVLAESRT